jgi:hypothetical protein
MIFSAGPGRIALNDEGVIVGARHRTRPDDDYLRDAARVSSWLEGTSLSWGEPDIQRDADEVQIDWHWQNRLRLSVRHAFTAGWGMRMALVNLTGERQFLDAVDVSLQVAPTHIAWGLAAGREAAFSVHPGDGGSPVLGGLLQVGSIAGFSPAGAQLGKVELVPHGRYVLSWQWDWYSNPRAFGRGRHSSVPNSFFLITEQPARITAGPDTAVLAPGLSVLADDGDTIELQASVPGVYTVELRSATGVVGYSLSAADPPDVFLNGLATDLLDGPRTPAGVVRIEDVAAGLIVQHALSEGQLEQPEEAADALARLAGRISQARNLDPLALAFLSGQAVAERDVDLLDTVVTGLLACSSAVPGLGVAALRLRAASLVLGVGTRGGAIERLRTLIDSSDAGRANGSAEDRDPMVAGDLAELELAIIVGSSEFEGKAERDVHALVGRLGLQLGAGLKGRPVVPIALVELAQIAVVLDLLPERLGAAFGRHWLCSPGELGRRARTEVINRCSHRRPERRGGRSETPEAIRQAAAWLALGQSTAG